MTSLHLEVLTPQHEALFLEANRKSAAFYAPWMSVPVTQEDFSEFLARYSQDNHRSLLLMTDQSALAGFFNLSQIVRGPFQNAYLGFSAHVDYAGKGIMSAGLKLVLAYAFEELKLHRLEANIQPNNAPSIRLVKANRFRKEGYSERYLNINGEWRDFERWAITYEDWE